MPDAALAFLLVSCASLGFQVVALARLAGQRAASAAERLAGRGYRRTVACRALAAAVYVTAAAIQLAGAGTLSLEALAVFTGIQGLWIGNTLLDMRVRRALARDGGNGAGQAP